MKNRDVLVVRLVNSTRWQAIFLFFPFIWPGTPDFQFSHLFIKVLSVNPFLFQLKKPRSKNVVLYSIVFDLIFLIKDLFCLVVLS